MNSDRKKSYTTGVGSRVEQSRPLRAFMDVKLKALRNTLKTIAQTSRQRMCE